MESITFEISLYMWIQIAEFQMSASEPSVGCMVEPVLCGFCYYLFEEHQILQTKIFHLLFIFKERILKMASQLIFNSLSTSIERKAYE
jgi:hypothetical protein